MLKVPASAWTPAVETSGELRDGAWVAELTGDVQDGWPKGMRLIVRKERPHPGAQLRLPDADGMRLTCFATNISGRPIAELELRHRLRARAEDRIRNARATGPAQPSPAPHGPESDLAGDRADCPRPAGLDADARPYRQGPALGAPPPTAPSVWPGRRTHRRLYVCWRCPRWWTAGTGRRLRPCSECRSRPWTTGGRGGRRVAETR